MIEYIFIAILQGIFEWLPISSSGQVMIVAISIFGISAEEAFSLAIFLHLGTTFAVLLKFRKDYIKIIKSFLPSMFEVEEIDIKKRNWLIIATIATAITALPLYFIFKYLVIAEFSAYQGDIITLIISALLIITGMILLISKKRFGNLDLESMEKGPISRNSFIAGLAQGTSILPGISRSGITVSTILFENHEQDSALKLSFIMSVPAAIASIGVDILFGEGSVFGSLDLAIILLITAISFIVGYLSMEGLLRLAKKVDFGYFCIVYGVVAFLIIVPFILISGA